MTVKVGREGVYTQLNEEVVRRCVLLPRVMFQEVLLTRIYTVNIQDKMGAEKYLGESCYYRIKCDRPKTN